MIDGERRNTLIVATDKQINYIEILANDLKLDIHRRNAYITSIVSREIKALDELSKSEASLVIGRFKEWKETQRMSVDPRQEEIP